MLDKYGAVTVAACVFALIVFPILTFAYLPRMGRRCRFSPPEPRLFWPAMTAITILLAAQNRLRFDEFTWPPHILCLFAYLTCWSKCRLGVQSTELVRPILRSKR